MGRARGYRSPKPAATHYCTQIEFKLPRIKIYLSKKSNETRTDRWIDRSRKRICTLRSGRRWLVHLSRHCLPTRPGSDCDITAHFRSPCLITISLRILQASEHARSSTSSASSHGQTLFASKRTKKKEEKKPNQKNSGALTRPPPQSRGPCAGAPYSRRPLAGAAAAAASAAEPRSRRRAERWT